MFAKHWIARNQSTLLLCLAVGLNESLVLCCQYLLAFVLVDDTLHGINVNILSLINSLLLWTWCLFGGTRDRPSVDSRPSVVSNIVKVAFLPHYKYSQVVKQEHSWALMWHVEILHSLPSDSATPWYNTWGCRDTTRFYPPDGKGSKKWRLGL